MTEIREPVFGLQLAVELLLCLREQQAHNGVPDELHQHLRAELTKMTRHPRPLYMAKLLQELESEDPEVRRNAVLSLGLSGVSVAVPQLIERLRGDISPQVRQAAALGLGCSGGGEDVCEALLDCFALDSDEEVRAACLSALGGRLKMGDERVEHAVLTAARQGSDAERRAAASAMGESKRVAFAQVLALLLRDKNWHVRLAASCAFVHLGVTHKDLIATLETLMATAPDDFFARTAQVLLDHARRLTK